MERIGTAFAVCATSLFVLATPALSRTSIESAAPQPCTTSSTGGTTTLNWCGPAKATVKLAGKTLTFKGGICAVAPGFDGKPALTVNVGKYTAAPAKPKFRYFGLTGKPHPGTYGKGEHVISFQLAGKAYAMQGGALWAVPWPKVTIAGGGKKGSFSGHAFLGGLGKGRPASGSWSC